MDGGPWPWVVFGSCPWPQLGQGCTFPLGSGTLQSCTGPLGPRCSSRSDAVWPSGAHCPWPSTVHPACFSPWRAPYIFRSLSESLLWVLAVSLKLKPRLWEPLQACLCLHFRPHSLVQPVDFLMLHISRSNSCAGIVIRLVLWLKRQRTWLAHYSVICLCKCFICGLGLELK